MDRRSKLVVTLSLVALATVGVGSWAASAHAQTFRSNLSIHYDRQHGLWGHVGTASVCQEGRQITIHASGGGVVGTAVSGHAGMWSGVSVGSGSYYATVAQTTSGGYGGDDVCLADTSSTVTVP
jgi:hypothetical protein